MTSAAAQTWHYGLVSRWWAEFNLDGPEIDWFRPFVEAGQPALDAACGTGRLLVPYLQAGLDVDGSDISPDMLERVRERCEREGLPRAEPLRAGDARARPAAPLPDDHRLRRLRARRSARARHRGPAAPVRAPRARRHARPRQRVPYADRAPVEVWRKEERAELPRPWRDEGDRRTVADGSELELRSRRRRRRSARAARDARDARASLWQDGELVAEEEHAMR